MKQLKKITNFSRFFLLLFAAAVVFFIAFYLAMYLLLKSGKELQVPDLVGQDIVKALEFSANSGLSVKIQGFETSDKYNKNIVIRQRPAALESIKKNRPLLLTLSNGTRSVIMPDLTANNLSLAKYVLENNDLLLGRIAYSCSDQLPAEQIEAQLPRPFSNVVRHQRVRLVVSSGSCQQNYLMPDLSGFPLTEALLSLEAAGFVLHRSEYVTDRSLPPETIVAQDPAGGQWVTKEDLITFQVTPPAGQIVSKTSFQLFSLRLPYRFLRQKVEVFVHSPVGLNYSFKDFTAQGGLYTFVLPHLPQANFSARVENVQIPLRRLDYPGFFSYQEFARLLEVGNRLRR